MTDQPPQHPVQSYDAWAGQHPQQPASPGARAFPHPEPTPYHAMLRTWSYATWKPFVGIVIVVGAFFVLAAFVFLLVTAIAAAFESGNWFDNVMRSGTLKDVGPVELLGLNLGIASLSLVTWFIIRVVHGMRPRWLMSVVPGIRWRLLGVCAGWAVVAVIAQVVVGALLPGSPDGASGSVNEMTKTLVLSGVVVFLTTPLQAIGEEYVFRGYLMQAVGSLFRNKWVAMVVTALIFALAHGAQNFPLFFDRFGFGLVAAWLVTVTGGLEAGIALHIVNNFFALGIGLLFGDITQVLGDTDASWWNILLTLTQSGVYGGLVYYSARKMDLQTLTRPPTRAPSEAPTGTVGGDLATA
ncbi:hypothetical protein BH10ACT10_BH10ACT10_26470 [soil metagenome]